VRPRVRDGGGCVRPGLNMLREGAVFMVGRRRRDSAQLVACMETQREVARDVDVFGCDSMPWLDGGLA
jgi:hypothetical protein